MAIKDNSKPRTREQLIIDTFRLMIRNGDAYLTKVEIPLQTGGVFEKVMYKVKAR